MKNKKEKPLRGKDCKGNNEIFKTMGVIKAECSNVLALYGTTHSAGVHISTAPNREEKMMFLEQMVRTMLYSQDVEKGVRTIHIFLDLLIKEFDDQKNMGGSAS